MWHNVRTDLRSREEDNLRGINLSNARERERERERELEAEWLRSWAVSTGYLDCKFQRVPKCPEVFRRSPGKPLESENYNENFQWQITLTNCVLEDCIGKLHWRITLADCIGDTFENYIGELQWRIILAKYIGKLHWWIALTNCIGRLWTSKFGEKLHLKIQFRSLEAPSGLRAIMHVCSFNVANGWNFQLDLPVGTSNLEAATVYHPDSLFSIVDSGQFYLWPGQILLGSLGPSFGLTTFLVYTCSSVQWSLAIGKFLT